MPYGDTVTIQQTVWGDTKQTLPGSVTSANQEITSIINLILNRNSDFVSVPTEIVNIASLMAAEIIRNPKIERRKIIEDTKALLALYVNQAPSSENRWGNVFYI